MREKIKAIEVNLRFLLMRIERIKIVKPDYEVNAELSKAELKIDELNDVISKLESIIND